MGKSTAWYRTLALAIAVWCAAACSTGLAGRMQEVAGGEELERIVRSHAERANVDPLTLSTFVGKGGNEGGVVVRFTEYTFSRLTEAEAQQLAATVKDRPEHPGRSALRLYEAEKAARAKGLAGVGDTVAVMILDNRRWAVTSKGYFNDSQSAAMGGKDGGWRHATGSGGNVSIYPTFSGDEKGLLRDEVYSEANYFRSKIRDIMFAGFTAPFMELKDVTIKADSGFEVAFVRAAKDITKSTRVVLRGKVTPDGQVASQELLLFRGSGSDEQVVERMWFSDYRPAIPFGDFVPHRIETFGPAPGNKKIRELRLEAVIPIDLEQAESHLAAPNAGESRTDLLGDAMSTSVMFDVTTGRKRVLDESGKLRVVDQRAAANSNPANVGQHGTGWGRWVSVGLALPALVVIVLVVRKRTLKGA